MTLSPGAISNRWRIAVAGGLALAMDPVPARAHLVTTGMGPVYDGLLHFVLTPEDLVPVLALALLAGLRGPAHARWTLFVLPLAWLLGGWLGLAVHGWTSPVIGATSFVLLGGLVAADARLPLGATALLAALLGLWHGYLNGATMARPGPGGLGLVGIAAAVFTLVAVTAAFVTSLRPAWARLVVRVAGSWIAAIGLLLAGWGLRPGA
jgi:hydrogenase/urease accessory protein HupE